MHYLGIDVGKRASNYFVTDGEGKRVAKGTLPSNGEDFASLIEQLMELQEGVAVAIEAGNATFGLARAMERQGADVFVVHPLDNALIARSRKKTDAIDAKTLAEQRRRNMLPPDPVRIPSERAEALRHLITARESLVDDRTALSNRAQAILARYCWFPTKQSLTTNTGWRGVRQELNRLRRSDALIVRQCCRRGLALNADIRQLDKAIDQAMARDFREARDLLLTIPGVGRITSASIVAWCEDVRAFPTARDFTCYAGLTSSTRVSGNTRKDGGTRGTGNSHLGRVLVQAAMSFVQNTDPEHELAAWYEKVRRRRGWKKARVALGRKLAAVCYGVLKHRQPYNPRYLAELTNSPG